MQEIIIYKEEKEVEGLADKIAKANSISYLMPLVPWHPEEVIKVKNNALAQELFKDYSLSSITDDDLYFTKSVLVTTNWNKNDDVFGKEDTWAARRTPSHKPTNIEHDEKRLVGHITDCWAMTLDGELISDNIDIEDLPNIYNIVNGAVIYRNFRDKELAARANELIEQIEHGEKYVSMECNFTRFDYAVQKADGSCNVIPRGESTSWMTKHLRAYGGAGEYDGYKVGRLLKNITFSGKGYVDKPANPNSIIFNNAALFDFSSIGKENTIIEKNGVYLNRAQAQSINKENKLMSTELDILKTQLDEVKTQLSNALTAKASAEDKLIKADVSKFETTIADLNTQLVTAKDKVEKAEKKADEEEKKAKDAEKCKAELEVKVSEMAKAQLLSNRISTLVEAGIDHEIAEKKVNTYANLTDEQFTDISSDIVALAKKEKDDEEKKKKDKEEEDCKAAEELKKKEAGTAAKDEEEKKKDKMGEKNKKEEKGGDCGASDNTTNANTEILDGAKVEDTPNMSVAGETNEIADLRKELASAIAAQLGRTLED